MIFPQTIEYNFLYIGIFELKIFYPFFIFKGFYFGTFFLTKISLKFTVTIITDKLLFSNFYTEMTRKVYLQSFFMSETSGKNVQFNFSSQNSSVDIIFLHGCKRKREI